MKRIIVAITGASGAIYGIRALQMLREAGVERHLVLSPAAGRTISEETDHSLDDVRAISDRARRLLDDHLDTHGQVLATGSTPQLEVDIARGFSRTRPFVLAIWGLLLWAAAVGILKP